jgi:hypothetical protein
MSYHVRRLVPEAENRASINLGDALQAGQPYPSIGTMHATAFEDIH